MTIAVPEPRPTQKPARRKHKGIKLGGPADLQRAWEMIAGSAPLAVATLADVAENSTVPGARVAASKALLEFGGFRSADTVQILPSAYDQAAVVVAGDSPTARIHNRLEALRGKQYEPTAAPSMDDLRPGQPDVIDADPDQG